MNRPLFQDISQEDSWVFTSDMLSFRTPSITRRTIEYDSDHDSHLYPTFNDKMSPLSNINSINDIIKVNKSTNWKQINKNMSNANKSNVLSLDSCHIKNTDMDLVVNILIRTYKKHPHINKVSFHKNTIGELIHIDRLLEKTNIRDISFEDNIIDDSQVDLLMKMVKKYNVKKLNLSLNKISKYGSSKLSEVFNTLEEVYVDHVDVEDEVFWHNTNTGLKTLRIVMVFENDNYDTIVYYLSKNTSLHQLQITASSSIPFEKVIKSNKTLTYLNITDTRKSLDIFHSLATNDTIKTFLTVDQNLYKHITEILMDSNYTLTRFCDNTWLREYNPYSTTLQKWVSRNKSCSFRLNRMLIRFCVIFFDIFPTYVLLEILDWIDLTYQEHLIPVRKYNHFRKIRFIESVYNSIKRIKRIRTSKDI